MNKLLLVVVALCILSGLIDCPNLEAMLYNNPPCNYSQIWAKKLFFARRNLALCDIMYEYNQQVVFVHFRGTAPLYSAVLSGDYKYVEWLLQHGAGDKGRLNDIHCQNGDTCLHKACTYEYNEIAQLLLKYGASCDIPNARGNTVRMLYPEFVNSRAYTVWDDVLGLSKFIESMNKERASC